MSGTQPRAPIHARPWRTTEVEGAGDDAVCVKRFHDARWPGAWARRWQDRLRARREARRLVALARGGIPAPLFLGVRHGPRGVELRTQWIPGARPLAQVLGAPGCGRLARPLGQLLARLHAAGFSHGDLHAGNVVVDGEGRAWLVDARALRRLSASRMTGDVLAAIAATRESTTAGFRARLLCAYLRALPERLRDRGRALRARIDALEDEARSVRARDVDRELDRWLRDSGACALALAGGREVLLARCADRSEALARAERARAHDADPGVVVLRGPEADVERAWLDAATAREHGLRGPEPVALVRGHDGFALFRARTGARPLAACSDLGAARRRALARAAGSLAGELFDRRLALARPGVLVDPDGSVSIAPGAELVRTASVSEAIRPFRGLAASRFERAAFALAFAAAQLGTAGGRERIHAELARG